jgi:hypothetical protein
MLRFRVSPYAVSVCKFRDLRMHTKLLLTGILIHRSTRSGSALPSECSIIQFFKPARFPPWIADERKSATFFCDRGAIPEVGIFGCEPISKNALDPGITTSLQTIGSLDQAELRASFPKIPPKTDYGRIDDLDKLPVRSQQALAEYKRYLRVCELIGFYKNG